MVGAASMSNFDRFYRKLLLTGFFKKGWGKPEQIKQVVNFRKSMSNRETCQHLVSKDYPISIDKETKQKDHQLLEGHFESPLKELLPGLLPKEAEVVRFQFIVPKNWQSHLKPVCIQLAGTGDHGYNRRKLLALPLVRDGVGSILLENPYYGCRKPKGQLRSSLLHVNDLFVMGGALIVESLALLHWCENQGYGPLGLTGISMGGYMASLAATNWDKPISLVPCLSWTTASSVFTKGVLSDAINWKVLEDQYLNDDVYEREIRDLLVSPEPYFTKTSAYEIGHEFGKLTNDLARDKERRSLETNNNVGLVPNYSNIHSGDSSQSVYTTSNSPPSAISRGAHFIKKAASSLRRSKTSEGANIPSEILRHRTLDFMRGFMDECTHLGNFSIPVDPELIIIVTAKHDAYIPRDDVMCLQKLWTGSEVRYLDSGHITGFLRNQNAFRQAILDSFEKQVKKYNM